MGSTLGYRKGIGEHGRQRRDYYTLFAFVFFVLLVLCFAALHWFLFFSHIFPILLPLAITFHILISSG